MERQCGACLNNSYAFKSLDVDDVCSISSLRRLCLKALSNNSVWFTAEHLSYLPVEILDDFQWHLSVHDLLRYSCLFEAAGINTSPVWERHYVKRYGQTTLRKWYFEWMERHVSEESSYTFQAQYLQYHCSELLSSVWNMDADCKCCRRLCFYLKFTPNLILRWRNSGHLKNENIRRAIEKNVKHLDVWGIKGKTFTRKEVEFLMSCECLKSIYFKNFNLLSMFYHCTIKPETRETNKKQRTSYRQGENMVASIKATLGDEDVEFLTTDMFLHSGVTRLNILSYERMLSDCQLSGKGWFDTALTQLTHLTLTGEILSHSLMDELISSLFRTFKDPLREPLKYLCLVCNGNMVLKYDIEEFSGQTYAVEKFEILHAEVVDEVTVSKLIQFLKCNRCLLHLNFFDTSVRVPRYSSVMQEGLIDICTKRNLRHLTLPMMSGFKFDFLKILSDSPEVTYLKLQGPGSVGNMVDSLMVLKCHKSLKTLSLCELILGEAGKDILVCILTSDCTQLSSLDLRYCHIQGEDIISAARIASESRFVHKLHILDISMNKFNRQQQTEIKILYRNLTDILIVDIPDRPQMEFVAQM